MKHVADILKAAGVQLSGEEDDDTVANAMTSWLGLSDEILAISDDSAVLTVDDCLPLSDAVYEAAADWLVAAWSGNNTSRFLSLRTTTTNATTTNPLLAEAAALSQNDDDGADKLISLEAAFESVRATKWLRAWLEFNVSDPLHLIADQSMSITSNNLSSSLSRQLLRVDAVDPNAQIINDGNKNNSSSDTTYHKVSIKNALIRALYKHVQDLPDLQQQMLSFSQYLQRADPHSMAVTPSGGGVLKDPNSRLRQYERAMAVSNQLHAEWQEHTFRLQCILGDVYAAGNPDQRKLCRRLLGHVWSTFVLQSSTSNSRSLRQENTKAAAIAMTLTVLRRILSGMMLSSDTLSDATHHLLFQQLIPLHKADGLVLWRDQTAVLELYHEPLCQCMALIFQRNVKQLIPSVLQQILQPNIFPVAGNTSKQVLLLHEVDSYLLLLVPTDGSSVAPMERSVIVSENTLYLKEERAMMQTLYQVLGRCMSSEHSRVAERALQFFQNASFEKLVFSRYLELGLHTLLPALVRREPSWNPTVRKMTYNVLKKLQGCIMFEPICNCIFSEFDAAELSSTRETATATISSNKVLTKATTIAASQMEEAAARRAMASSTSDFSLKTGMGSWRPTSAATLREPGSMPPPSARRPSHPSGAPGRGMAPWIQMPSIPGSIPSSVTPPLTVTGVAPWAMKPAAPPPTALGHKRVAPEVHLKEIGEEMNADDVEPIPRTGLEYVLTNMEKIKPPDEEEGVSSWSCAQMAETPTYLPHLKFHDLVFGHDLGSGAFGSVKYVRLIEKTKPRSQWPEYAVKVVSTEKIRALGYEASIQREIAVLRFLSHPGIARLVSSFRFHDGAYLVLEYASRGDLHTLLQKHGSLDIDSTRFVIGEVVAALVR